MHFRSMSNPIVRIALVNIILAVAFAGLVAIEMPFFPATPGVLVAIAVLINAVALFTLRRSSRTRQPEPPAQAPLPAADGTEGSLGRVRATTPGERKPPRPANRHNEETPAGEMPPWLRMKGNIVMTWNGKHHVAPINGDDPFEVAQRLYERLRRAEAGDKAGASEMSSSGSAHTG